MMDEVLIHLAPVLLGDGVRLFSQPGGKTVRLERVDVEQAADVTNLWYRVDYEHTEQAKGQR